MLILLFKNAANAVYLFFAHLIASYDAHNRKKRSEYALERLDEHLLRDIGLRRVEENIVPLRKVVSQKNEIGDQRRKKRLRHAYLFRRRRLHAR